MSFATMTSPMPRDFTRSMFSPTQTRFDEQAQQTQGDNPAQPDMPTTSTLLFGFLISVLALFSIFVGGGLSARYFVDRRRQRAATNSNQLDGDAQGKRQPALWDVWTMPGHGKWEDMMPLSAEVCPHSPSPPLEPLERTERIPGEHISQLHHGSGRNEGHPFALPPHRPPSRLSAHASSRASMPWTAEDGVNLRIAVLVVMPSPASLTRDRTSISKRPDVSSDREHVRAHEIHDIAMGVATIPWDRERIDFG